MSEDLSRLFNRLFDAVPGQPTKEGAARVWTFTPKNSLLHVVNKHTDVEFSYYGDRVNFEGTCATMQDLRDALRQLLADLEAR